MLKTRPGKSLSLSDVGCGPTPRLAGRSSGQPPSRGTGGRRGPLRDERGQRRCIQDTKPLLMRAGRSLATCRGRSTPKAERNNETKPAEGASTPRAKDS